ncbi:MAG: hypothetical protein HQ567_16965 [Candidatus Nealsonbacteria bacterium]|nr:hypothetical protein [Candidatus Nealsonbacteria bacterium]
MTKSRYPRHGHRIAPTALRKILQVPVPVQYHRGKEDADLWLCDLDESAWEIFDEQTCRNLAEEVLQTVGREVRAPLAIASEHLPAIPDGMTLADLDLEVRTINCLVSAGIHERPQDLASMTIEGVLGLRGFWVKSLVDLLTSLEHVIDHPEARRAVRSEAITSIKHLRAAHRYPRPNHRLAPQTLKEILLDQIPAQWVRKTPLRNARLCDLDESAWKHLSQNAIGQLAAMIVTRAGAASHNETILQRHLPRPPDGMRLEDLRLENRTHNCLAREGLDRHPKRLGELTVAELFSFKAFGAKCLVDLLSSLETRVAREGKLDKQLTAAAKALGKMTDAHEIQFTDPRLGRLLRAMDTESNTVGEMVQRFIARRLDPPDPVRLGQQIGELRTRIRQLSDMPLEDELIEIFAPGFSPRDRQIVSEYYGWDGGGGHTLEHLGRKYGLSRERIRQICVRAIKRNHDTTVFAPVLDRALEFLSERFPAGLDALQAEFDDAGFSGRPLPVESVRLAGEFLSRHVPFSVVDVGRNRMAVALEQAEIPRAIVQAAKQVVTNYGAARTAEVMAELADRFDKKIDPSLVRETLQTQDDFRWLDGRRTWFRLSTFPLYGLPNMVEKILSVTGRIEVAKLRTAMARYRRSGRQLPPPGILLEFCRQMPGVRIEGNRVISESKRDWRKILADVERKMVEVLKKHGPIMERTAFEEECISRGMNRFSFNAIVMCSPVIAQYGRSVYGLLGEKIDRKTVEELANRKAGTTPNRVLKSFGKTDDGRVFLAYELSKASISGGVITVPAALKRQLRGKYTLRTDQGHKVGTLVARKGCGWGLGPALRGGDAKQGDHMLLLFDGPKRQANIRVGDETILDGVVEE